MIVTVNEQSRNNDKGKGVIQYSRRERSHREKRIMRKVEIERNRNRNVQVR